MTLEVRLAVGAEHRVARHLFGRVEWLSGHAVLFLATDPGQRRLLGAALLDRVAEREARAAFRVAHRIVVRDQADAHAMALLRSVAAAAARCGSRELETTHVPAAGPEAARLAAAGFAPHAESIDFECAVRDLQTRLVALRRARARDAVGARLAIQPYARCDYAATEALHLRHLGLLPPSHPAMRDGTREAERARETSFVALHDGALAGAVVISAGGREADVESIVVDPRHHGTLATLLLIEAGCQALARRGVETFFYSALADNVVMINLARRMGGREVRRAVGWRLALAPPRG